MDCVVKEPQKKIEYDYSKLKGRIIEKFGSLSNFAEKVGTSKQTVSLKINNKIDFRQTEIRKWSKLLEIPDVEVWFYFFVPLVKEDRLVEEK